MEMSFQRHALAALPPENKPGSSFCTLLYSTTLILICCFKHSGYCILLLLLFLLLPPPLLLLLLLLLLHVKCFWFNKNRLRFLQWSSSCIIILSQPHQSSYFYHFNNYTITTRFIKNALSKDSLLLRLEWFLVSDNFPSQN